MKTFYITPVRQRERQHRVAFESGVETIKYDYSAWAEDNGTVTDVTISTEFGQASVGNESLASNVKTFTVTTAETGRTVLKLVATAGNNKDVQYLEVRSKKPYDDHIVEEGFYC